MNETILNNLNELKGALENLTDADLLENRLGLLKLTEECLNEVEEESIIEDTTIDITDVNQEQFDEIYKNNNVILSDSKTIPT